MANNTLFNSLGNIVISSGETESVLCGENAPHPLAHSHRVCCACFSVDRNYVISGNDDDDPAKNITVWKVDPISDPLTVRLRSFPSNPKDGHAYTTDKISCASKKLSLAGVTRLCVSADGQYIVSASRDFTVKIWTWPMGSLVRTLKGHSAAVQALCLTHGNKEVVSGGCQVKYTRHN